MRTTFLEKTQVAEFLKGVIKDGCEYIKPWSDETVAAHIGGRLRKEHVRYVRQQVYPESVRRVIPRQELIVPEHANQAVYYRIQQLEILTKRQEERIAYLERELGVVV